MMKTNNYVENRGSKRKTVLHYSPLSPTFISVPESRNDNKSYDLNKIRNKFFTHDN